MYWDAAIERNVERIGSEKLENLKMKFYPMTIVYSDGAKETAPELPEKLIQTSPQTATKYGCCFYCPTLRENAGHNFNQSSIFELIKLQGYDNRTINNSHFHK